MKRFIAIVMILVAVWVIVDALHYRFGFYIDLSPKEEVTSFMKTEGSEIYRKTADGYEKFEIKGMNMGLGIPGKTATEAAIDEETYLRWFAEIQELGANTIRIYTIQGEDFYNAFYKYNKGRKEPLYLIHGVWVNDYIQNSYRDAYHKDFYDTFLKDCITMVDVIHGQRKLASGQIKSAGHGTYRNDISEWVIGYILGIEWEDLTVAYTDEKYAENEEYNTYQGTYMYTSENATPFEAMLAKVGDKVIAYESKRYKEQRLVAFSNWPTTDPFVYPDRVSSYFMKCAYVDVEHIKTTEQFISGQFVSYHVYPYYPDYLSYISDWSAYGIERKDFIREDKKLNTYKAYLKVLTTHHTMPVVISEFGVTTGRGMAQRDLNTNRNQGKMSEQEQGQALIDCYDDIMTTGCAGGCVFTWQDEWFKRTWNTMYAVDLDRTPFWSDYQTNEQYFGMLSFDPGKESSVSYVDGDISEWAEEDIVFRGDGLSLSMKYDEKFIYFMLHKKELDFEHEVLYIPIDVTPKSGSNYCKNYNLFFERAVDFLVVLNGKEDSRIQVQERYEALRSTYSHNLFGIDAYEAGNQPDKDSPLFVNINMILQTATSLINGFESRAEAFETGHLTYGNANPDSEYFNSLADFIVNGDYIELKLPWQLLNFGDPSQMKIHDDYYDGNYGVEFIKINEMWVGACTGETSERVSLVPFELNGWGKQVTYHERLKASYYMLQSVWRKPQKTEEDGEK